MSSLRSKTLSLLTSKRAALPVEIPEIRTEEGGALVLHLLPPSVAQMLQLQGSGDDKSLSDVERARKMSDVTTELLIKLVVDDENVPLFSSVDEIRDTDMRVFSHLSKALMTLMTEGVRIMTGDKGDEPTPETAAKPKFVIVEGSEPGNASSGA